MIYQRWTSLFFMLIVGKSNNSENGIETQFYLVMTLAILQLNFKQTCQEVQHIVPFFKIFIRRVNKHKHLDILLLRIELKKNCQTAIYSLENI